MHAIVTLEKEPRFRPFPFGLPVEAPLLRAVDDAALVLSRTKGRFDGPIAFCHGVSRDGAVLRRHGRYAEAMVVFAEPSLGYRLGFALGVQLFVQRPEGPFLFQQRGPSIGRDPLLWTASASGGLSPTETPRDAVLADAAEEIGLVEADLLGFRPDWTRRQRRHGVGARRLPRDAAGGRRARAERDEGHADPLGRFADRPGSPGLGRHGRLLGCARALARA